MATASKDKSKNKLKMDSKAETGKDVRPSDNGKSNNVDAEGPRERALKVDIGIEGKNRSRSIEILNKVLANQSVLTVKTRNYHWNVTGIHFRDLHKFLEEQYTVLSEYQDVTAERIRMLGGRPLGNMAQFVQNASLKEETRDRLDAFAMLHSLLSDHEQVIRELRDAIDEMDSKLEDAGNADYLVELLREHEKSAWMIRVMCE